MITRTIVKIILALVLVFIGVLVISSIKFNREVKNEVKELLSKAEKKEKIVTEEMLKDLPAPVQRYLRSSGVVGKPWINTVHLKQTGQLRMDPRGKWFSVTAEEYFSVNPSRFFWHAWIPFRWMPIIRGSDGYNGGEGQLLIKLFSIFTLVDARSEKVNQGEMVRYLNEMMWFPTAFLEDNISWEAINNNSAKVTLTNQNKSVSAVMHFDDEGKLTNFVAERYYSDSLETWGVPITAYGKMAGLNLPIRGHTIWKLKSGDFTDIDLTVNEIEYNLNQSN